MSIGNNIKKFREMNKLTQDDLASRLFVTRQTISNYENERSRPDLDMLIQIADVLNVDIKDIIYGKETIYQKMVKKYLLFGLIVFVGLFLIIFVLSNYDDSYGWQMKVNTLNSMYLFPLISIVFGWCCLRCFQICFQIRSSSFKFLKWSKFILLFIALFWLVVVVLPMYVNVQLPVWLRWLLVNVWSYRYIYYGLFVVFGVLLGCLVDGNDNKNA